MGKKETPLQNKIRVAASQLGCRLFRVNVGRAWTGNKTKRHPDGSITIFDPRPFHAGVPTGYPDLTGFIPLEITEDMAGETVAVFTAVEVKTPKGRRRAKQDEFLANVSAFGAIAGLVRSEEEVRELIASAKRKLTGR